MVGVTAMKQGLSPDALCLCYGRRLFSSRRFGHYLTSSDDDDDVDDGGGLGGMPEDQQTSGEAIREG